MERAAVDIIGVKIPIELFIVRYPIGLCRTSRWP